MLRGGGHYNKHLQHAWDLYGETNFVFEFIEEVEDFSKLTEREQNWIDIAADQSYNIQKVAGAYNS